MKIVKPSELKLSVELLKSQAQTLYVTATESGAGTTTCSYALALALRELVTEPVLLIDGNTDDPELTRHFRLSGTAGFNEWVQSGSDDALNDYVHLVEEEDIHFMGNGSPTHARGIAERINPKLAELNKHYPFVVFDGPDLSNPVGMSLATHFNGVVLVSAESETRLDAIQKAQQQIKQGGGHLVGTVLNKRRNHIPPWLSKFI